jgi:glucosamine--fructose-6-phosphate aminotransferase (isomerizing)
MCGIIGIITKEKKDISPLLIGALSRLEYRGYDSAGIAIDNQGEIRVLKCVGAPSDNLHADDVHGNGDTILSSVGIGHNRWATHGKPTLQNAHPHIDSKKRVAVVHNGTILNYEILKKELQAKGVIFLSETDTEVIPHLIASYLEKGVSMEEAFTATISLLEGAYGVVAFDTEDSSTLYVAKQGSPIVIGVAQDSYYVASSIHGFLPLTDRFMTLLDGEMAVLTIGKEPSIRSIKEKKVMGHRASQVAATTHVGDLSKGDFETFMLKEIFEQPATTQATITGRTDEKSGTAVLGGLFDSKKILEEVRYLLLTGCGTAYHAGEVGAYILEQLADVSVRVEVASEGRYKQPRTPREETVVFAISQSGETADTLEYIKELKLKQYETFGIVNVVGSALAELTGKGVYTKAGSEIGVASTKAFTAQLAVMYLLTLYIARMKNMNTEEGVKFVTTFESIPHRMKETLELSSVVKDIVQKYKAFTKIQFLGRGVHVPIAKEAALKFKEITYLETGAYPLGELKHGPIAIVDSDTLSVVILPSDTLFSLGVNSIEQIKSKGGKVLLITDESVRGEAVCNKVDDVIFIPHLTDELFYPFLEIIPLQLFAYYFAQALGRNIDKPRNLAKSVTVQ